ncbi:MAG: bacteriohemerythrin [Magnetococcus sp. XQGC-1]
MSHLTMSFRGKLMLALLVPAIALLALFLFVLFAGDPAFVVTLLAWLLPLLALWLLAAAGLLLHFTLGPLQQLRETLQRMIAGHWTARIPRDAEGGDGDEIDQLAGQVNQLADKVCGMMTGIALHSGGVVACASEILKIRDLVNNDAKNTHQVVQEVSTQNAVLAQEIGGVKQSVTQASRSMESISHAANSVAESVSTIASGTEQASINITTMAAAAEEITANIDGVNRSLNQVDGAVKHVATAVKDMTNALSEVRERCQLASDASAQTNQRVHDTQAVMNQLSTAAGEIGKFVKIIKNIADQTSLLALNASVEAAGAGEAGKSFSVVANEVKELSRQTEKATWIIREKTESITTIAASVAAANQEIIDSVNSINQANQVITYAVEEQTSAINDIAASMNDVTNAAGEVTRNAQELGVAAQDVARAAAEAALGTAEVARSAAMVSQSAITVAEDSRLAMEVTNAILDSAEKTLQVSLTVANQMAEADRTSDVMRASALQFDRIGGILQEVTGALYATQLEVDVGPPLFNLRAAKGAYLQCQSRLEQAISGRKALAADELERMDKTEFNRWLQTGGKKRFAHSSIYQSMLTAQKSTHEAIRRIMTDLQETTGAKRQQVDAHLAEFLAARQQLFAGMDKLYQGMQDTQEQEQPFMAWNSALDTGLQDVDSDHRKLVDMLNQLHRAMKKGESKESMQEILKKLAEYTVFHFRREEEYFAKTGYPETAAHQAEHKKLVAMAVDFVQRFGEGDFAIVIDLMTALKGWLVGHIQGADIAYAPYMKQHGIR